MAVVNDWTLTTTSFLFIATGVSTVATAIRIVIERVIYKHGAPCGTRWKEATYSSMFDRSYICDHGGYSRCEHWLYTFLKQ